MTRIMKRHFRSLVQLSFWHKRQLLHTWLEWMEYIWWWIKASWEGEKQKPWISSANPFLLVLCDVLFSWTHTYFTSKMKTKGTIIQQLTISWLSKCSTIKSVLAGGIIAVEQKLPNRFITFRSPPLKQNTYVFCKCKPNTCRCSCRVSIFRPGSPTLL